MKTEILATLGPASLNDRVIHRLEALGVTLFRLNLSHTRLDQARELILYVQQTTSVPLSLDTEGAQIRTGDFVERTIHLRENGRVRAHRRPVPGDAHDFNLYPAHVVDRLVVGDLLAIDAAVLGQVIETAPGRATLRVLRGGTVGQNKAVTVERSIELPPLTEKDEAILAIGRELGIRHVALSFASRASDLDLIRAAAGPEARVISKIESRAGLRNLAEIAERSDALLIDRGDLSRQVPIERIPATQKAIIRLAKRAGRPVYVATNLMESMVTDPHPTRAEVNDVYNTLIDGADGLVLAAETAIGQYPIECVGMVVRLAHEFEAGERDDLADEAVESISLLVEPHGGRLVQRRGRPEETDDLRRLVVDAHALVDCRQLGLGTYSPLGGFMDRATLDAVLSSCRLPGGTVWPLPLLLQLPEASAEGLRAGERVTLCDAGGRPHAWLDVSEVFPLEPEGVAERWFGTAAPDHPGALRLRAGGGVCLAGEVTLLDAPDTAGSPYALPPDQSRFVLARKGWSRVVGLHVREVPRLAHEAAQLAALDRAHADGLLLTAEAGPRRPDEARSGLVIECYQRLLDFAVYPPASVVLTSLPGYARDCPAREAVFLALCHKNLGCSHFVLADPDPAVGPLLEELGELGIETLEVEVGRDGAMREIVRELVEGD